MLLRSELPLCIAPHCPEADPDVSSLQRGRINLGSGLLDPCPRTSAVQGAETCSTGRRSTLYSAHNDGAQLGEGTDQERQGHWFKSQVLGMAEVGLVLAVKGLSSAVVLFCTTPAQGKHMRFCRACAER